MEILVQNIVEKGEELLSKVALSPIQLELGIPAHIAILASIAIQSAPNQDKSGPPFHPDAERLFTRLQIWFHRAKADSLVLAAATTTNGAPRLLKLSPVICSAFSVPQLQLPGQPHIARDQQAEERALEAEQQLLSMLGRDPKLKAKRAKARGTATRSKRSGSATTGHNCNPREHPGSSSRVTRRGGYLEEPERRCGGNGLVPTRSGTAVCETRSTDPGCASLGEEDGFKEMQASQIPLQRSCAQASANVNASVLGNEQNPASDPSRCSTPNTSANSIDETIENSMSEVRETREKIALALVEREKAHASELASALAARDRALSLELASALTARNAAHAMELALTLKAKDEAHAKELESVTANREETLASELASALAAKDAAHASDLREARERASEVAQALQLRLYISETRVRVLEDALDSHIAAAGRRRFCPPTTEKLALPAPSTSILPVYADDFFGGGLSKCVLPNGAKVCASAADDSSPICRQKEAANAEKEVAATYHSCLRLSTSPSRTTGVKAACWFHHTGAGCRFGQYCRNSHDPLPDAQSTGQVVVSPLPSHMEISKDT